MRKLAAAALAVLQAVCGAVPASAATGRRVIVYYQTIYNGSAYVSPLGLTQHNAGVTDVLVGAIHLDLGGVVHVNDNPPSAAKFTQMWQDLGTLRSQGVHTLAFLGGAAQGSFQRLASDFDTYYPPLRALLRDHSLSGIDLEIEETVDNTSVVRLIDALRADFGPSFLITFAPVAPELSGGRGLSGLNYDQLYRDRGPQISWFNTQFYCGWGSMSDTGGDDAIIRHGVVPAAKVVAGTVTNPANCSGYIDMPRLQSTIRSLTAKYPDFGGVDGWEYFNSLPGGTAAPWQWAQQVAPVVKG
ncbi:glycosyl hydrolase family 18 protein [Amycolatopsis sp. NPDC005232]|uniref:glycosyl hydrolase family 18 protein n=1 Tax=Amycolatopsis sp. NPDC005232 TaxID=3157027 RepID=UPI0033A6EFA4